MRWRRVIGLLAALILAVLVVDYALVRSKERHLSSVVFDLGGRMGSLPFWPIGTEYVISFRRRLNQSELHRLQIANRMRGSVLIYFYCELSNTEKTMARAALPACRLIVVQGSEIVRIE